MRPGRLASLCVFALFPTGAAAQWEAPQAAKERRNPLTNSKDTLKKGQKLYKKHCSSCHGSRGRGDGPAAGYRMGTPVDLTIPELREMSDGEMFWKISTGLKDDTEVLMPSFTREMPNELDRWRVVVFVRTLHRTATDP